MSESSPESKSLQELSASSYRIVEEVVAGVADIVSTSVSWF